MKGSNYTVFIPLVLSALFMAACGTSEQNSSSDGKSLTVVKKEYGTTPEGEMVYEYTLTNSNGIEMKVINYGGIITSLSIPDRDGNLGDIVLGFDNLKDYLESNPYFGAIVGRYGNRIANGKFEIDGNTYELVQNNGKNHLHGGLLGFDKVIWEATTFQSETSVGITFSYLSENMEEGYPGNLESTVVYLLDDEDQLTFDYSAISDAPTIVNLTNHSYFNLSPGTKDILAHELLINAGSYLPVDSTLIPYDQSPVAETPFDFRNSKPIGRDINASHPQLVNGLGYDHCWVIQGEQGNLNLAATLYEPASGRRMQVFTTEPGVQFYSGNFLDGSLTGKGGITYGHRSGLCLETQHFPDSPNRPDFPGVILRPGDTYKTKTLLKFSTQ